MSFLNTLKGPAPSTEPPPGSQSYSFSPPTGPVDPAAMAEGRRLVFGTLPATPAAVKPADIPEWEAKFKRAPYWRPDQSFDVPRMAIFEVSKLTNIPVLLKDEKAFLLSGSDMIAKMRSELENHTETNLQQQRRERIMENERKVHAGELPEREINMPVELARLEIERKYIRDSIKAVRVRLEPVIKGICIRFEGAARKAVEIIDAQEKATAAKYGLAFYPSFQLVVITWAAVEGARLQGEHSSGNVDHLLWNHITHDDLQPK